MRALGERRCHTIAAFISHSASTKWVCSKDLIPHSDLTSKVIHIEKVGTTLFQVPPVSFPPLLHLWKEKKKAGKKHYYSILYFFLGLMNKAEGEPDPGQDHL